MGGSGKWEGEIVTRKERVPMTRDSSSVITKGILVGGEKDGTKRKDHNGKNGTEIGAGGWKSETLGKQRARDTSKAIYVYI